MSVSPALWTWVPSHIVAFGYTAILSVLLFQCAKGGKQNATFSNKVLPRRYTLSLSNNGRIQVVDVENAPVVGALTDDKIQPAFDSSTTVPMQIHSASQVYPWGICIQVARVKRRLIDKGHAHFTWVLKNECSEANYRRLARAVIFVSKGTSSRK